MKIDILLSTYNGGLFLEELLQSLFNQTFINWRLIVRDDGSTDNTLEILNSCREKDRERVFIIDNKKKHLGPKKSFEVLLNESNADYIMFCDQDDVWLPAKIEDTFDKMSTLKKKFPEKPLLVFTDLKVTDKDLKTINTSYWNYTRVNPDNIHNMYRLLINNPVVGCTVMINNIAKKVVLPIPGKAVMHDWWMALTVAQKGIIDYVNKATVLYRLHEKNNLGASLANRKYYARRMIGLYKTIPQNYHAFQMLRLLDFSLSPAKLAGYKIMMTFLKIINR